jgi:hypothetical protein
MESGKAYTAFGLATMAISRMWSMFCAVLLLGLSGCAQRTLTITSEPSGALVYLNGDEIGRTPLKFDFMWYSDYDVVLRKEGYETLKTHQNLKAPLLGLPILDLAGELVGTKDRREWNFVMTPADPQAANEGDLLTRAAELKAQLRSTKNTRPPTTLPTTLPAPATQPTTAPASAPTQQ